MIDPGASSPRAERLKAALADRYRIERELGQGGMVAADAYALGCVLYEMLTGEPPFSGATAQAVVAKLLTSEPEPITTLRKIVPPHVEAATHTERQRLPADRFSRAADFTAALSGAATTVPWRGTGARPAAPRTSRMAPLLPWLVEGLATVVAVAVRTVHGEPRRAGVKWPVHRSCRFVIQSVRRMLRVEAG